MNFNKTQWRVLSACMIIYTTAYLNRLNVAAALSGIISALGITTTQGGLLQTAFAIVYAAGQLVNGAIVDRVDPIKYIKIGIAGSGACNLLLGLCPSYTPMAILCMLNGMFQSMMWTPIVRTIALHFREIELREKATTILLATLIVGNLGAWAISGYLSNIFSWHYSFIVPAVIVIPALLGGSLLLRGIDHGKPDGTCQKQKTVPASNAASPYRRNLFAIFASSGFFVMLITGFVHGFVRDGIQTWTPTILNRLSNGHAIAATTFSLIIPIVNIGGIVATYLAKKKGHINNRRMIAIQLSLSACFCLTLLGVKSMLFAAVFLGFACACIAGLGSILTGLVPIEYEPENLVGMTAGVIDSFAYIGSALAGVLAGFIYEKVGVNALFLCWIAAALLGAVCSLVAGTMMRRYRARIKL